MRKYKVLFLAASLFLAAGCSSQEVTVSEEIEPVDTTETETTEETPMTFIERAEILKNSVGDEGMSLQFVSDSIMSGYDATDMTNHQYTFTDVEDTGEWVSVTFNEDETVIEKVETSPNLK